MKFTLEICVESVQPAVDAINAGAGRIELCSSLSEGGVTPSYGLVKMAAEKINAPVHVIIRPRGGDFLYSGIEYETMKADIEFCKTSGISGIVCGILKPDGNVDIERTRELVNIAAPMNFTFHRAFDICADPFKALEDVIATGAHRLLTSGCRNRAAEGLELIARLVRLAGNRIIIMPGSGLNESNIATIAVATHATEFHMSAGINTESKMVFRNQEVIMGRAVESEYSIRTVDAAMIRRIEKILEKLDPLSLSDED